MEHLTKNFSLPEFAVSADHPYLASLIIFSETDITKLFYMCILNLQPIRDWLSASVKILSGKRTPELNKAVGGADHSDHLFDFVSAACDFTVPGYDMERIWHWVQKTNIPENHRPFGQLIFYPSKNFCHISMPTLKHHGEVFCR